jgi:hypothetical protein
MASASQSDRHIVKGRSAINPLVSVNDINKKKLRGVIILYLTSDPLRLRTDALILLILKSSSTILSHHQPINVPTAGAQAFLMDYPQGERAITHHAGPVRIGGC